MVRTPRKVHKTRLLLHTGSSLFSAPQKSRATPLKSTAEICQKAGESSQKLVLTKILGFPIDFPYTKAQHCEADCRSEAKGAREGRGGQDCAHPHRMHPKRWHKTTPRASVDPLLKNQEGWLSFLVRMLWRKVAYVPKYTMIYLPSPVNRKPPYWKLFLEMLRIPKVSTKVHNLKLGCE